MGALAAWLFLGGVMSNVVIGRMPFTLGIALAVGAWACARRSLLAAAALSLPSVFASPVAGVFLAVAAVATLAGRRDSPERRRSALALGAPAVVGGLAMAALFPEGGADHFTATAFWPMLLICLGALALVDPVAPHGALGLGHLRGDPRRRLRVPELARPERAAARRGDRPGPARALRPAPRPARRDRDHRRGLVYLQWLPAVRAVEEARGDPSTQAAFHTEVLRFLDEHAAPGERVEVPLTRNHWEANYVAESYPLARGWHRQLDRKVNPLFYDERARR